MRALDNIDSIPTAQLRQRRHELISELALVSKKNKTARASILKDYVKVVLEIDRR